MATKTWCWRRWIEASQQELWIGRLQAAGALSWACTERPARKRILLEVYVDARAKAVALKQEWGGQVSAMDATEWLNARPAPPTRIGQALEIIHEKAGTRKVSDVPRLHVPHGMAFGSGEHATTYMLLRSLAARGNWSKTSVLDLGTGSGVLALTARLFGAKKIVATDFDPEAVRTARQNEELNFSQPLIRWKQADVKYLRAKAKYDLVLANLFSGILAEAASQISSSVSPDGQLWLSGILHTQKEEVIDAYDGKGVQLIRTMRRGKWIMLQFSR